MVPASSSVPQERSSLNYPKTECARYSTSLPQFRQHLALKILSFIEGRIHCTIENLRLVLFLGMYILKERLGSYHLLKVHGLLFLTPDKILESK